MVFGKRGQGGGGVWTVLIWVGITLIIVGIILVYASETGVAVGVLEDLPGGVEVFYETFLTVATPIVSGLYWVVAPADEGENVQMIAFAIFLLIALVGTKSLRPFLSRGGSPFLAFFISVIVGVIAARSLTATVLEESALGASPIAAVSLLLGFIPVFALTKNIDRWVLTQYSKMVVFSVAAAVYFLIFWFAFGAFYLGLVYGAGIVLLGAGQLIAPYYARARGEIADRSLGAYMAGREETVRTIRAMHRGSEGYRGGF